MNETPPVRYARTADGMDIAYCVSGSGEPVVFLPVGLTHLQLVHRYDRRLSEWFRMMQQRFQLVQYDSRGQGMSTRELGPDHTIGDLERDLEAVVDRLELERFVLIGYFYLAHVAVRYAVKHPERVKGLILISCSVSMDAWPLDSMIGMAGRNWDGFLHNWVPTTFSPEERQELVDYYRRARNVEDWLISARAFSVSEISQELSQLRTPTLVLHPRDFLWLPSEESMKVAASIENARFRLLDGVLPLGPPEESVGAIEAFVAGLDGGPGKQAPADVSRGFERLSERQLEVLKLIAEGRTTNEIAEALVLSDRTVERHIADVYAKIGARNRAEATAFALSNSDNA